MLEKFKEYRISFTKVILAYSFYITIIFNYSLLYPLSEGLNLSSSFELFNYFFIFLVYLTILFLTSIFLLIVGIRYLLKPTIFLLVLSCPIVAYYKEVYGISVDEGIIISLFDAIIEKNINEINDLLSAKLFITILLTAIVPLIPLFFIKIDYPSLLKEQAIRLSYIAGMILLLSLLIVSTYKNTSLTARTNKKISRDVVPLYSVSSLIKIIKNSFKTELEFTELDENPKVLNSKDSIVGIVVIGETARADHFSLNNYARTTNPNLERRNITNYSNAYSCGTLTKISVPCMFFMGDYNSFSVDVARNQFNLLDIISQSKSGVTWVENNSGCKHVCDRIDTIELTNNLNKENYDEVLVPYIDKILQNKKGNRTLIILHTMGSHGPKYYKRYPSAFDKFQPSCKSNNPQECSQKELINAFDNTLLYTDHVLNLMISKLEKLKEKSFLIYASDHGESLGELGLYLHGMPRSIAPKEQIHIPWFVWFSDSYKTSRDLKMVNTNTEISHEHFPHTILDALQIDSKYFKKEKSLIK
jgi:lipid A ethanolaminephosphotransferase